MDSDTTPNSLSMSYIKRILQSSCLASIKQYWWNLFINGLLASYVFPTGLRKVVLNICGCRIKGVIHGHCTMFTNRISIGIHSFVNRNCFIDNNAMVSIGNNCAVAYNVSLITTNHSIDYANKRGGAIDPLTIQIKDGCWIGANSLILPGTIIESGCVIAAGSVVRGVCKANCLYAGVPARIIRELDE